MSLGCWCEIIKCKSETRPLSERDAIPPSRLKDLKTSLRYLARALNVNGPDAVQDAEHLAIQYRVLLHKYFASLVPPASAHTIRNTLNNLSFIFRQAQAHDLVPTFSPRSQRMSMRQSRAQAQKTSPYRLRLSAARHGVRYESPIHEWPPLLRQAWDRYRQSRRLEVRAISLNSYERRLASLIGFSAYIEGHPITTWDEVFDVDRLVRFIHWHRERLLVPRITRAAEALTATLLMLAKHDNRPEYPALRTLSQKLPTSEPMHDKQHPNHTIQLKELEDIGLTLLHEARAMKSRLQTKNPHVRYPGMTGALRHQLGLILRLLVRVPMRQRNIREMQLGQNLFQDDHNTWYIRFHGEELKIGYRGGRTNTFHVPFPHDLTEHLEEFLHQYRPCLKNATTDSHVFLSQKGRPYAVTSFSQALAELVMQRIGKRFYPHLIRTIYADTCLLQTHDVSTVAFMLNDRPETVLQRYHELRANDHIQKAYQFTQSLLGTSLTSV